MNILQSIVSWIHIDILNVEISEIIEKPAEHKDKETDALQSINTKTNDNLNSFDENLIVIYNRVPKTGSTSFINLAYDLCKKNHFYVLHINITSNMHVLSLDNQVSVTHFKWRTKYCN